MNNIQTLEDVIKAGQLKEVTLANEPQKPLSAADAIALARSQETIADKPQDLISAISAGLAVNIQKKDGTVWEINKGGKPANIKGADSITQGQDASLEFILQSVMTNLETFTISDFVAWGKVAFAHYEPESIRTYCENRLRKLAKQKKIRCINEFEGTYSR